MEATLSVRFSSRQWLLLFRRFEREHTSFSPLFIAAMVATDLAISSRNSSKRRNHLRLYIIRVILTHRRCPVNFKRHTR